MRFSKPIIVILVAIIVAILAVGGMAYSWIWGTNVKTDLANNVIEIPSGSSYNDVLTILQDQDIIQDVSSFDFVAGLMKYKKDEVPSGRFKIQPGWNNRSLISLLRSGIQEPINLTFNNIRYTHELAGILSSYLAPDSSTFLLYLSDPEKISKLGFNENNILTMFIPNTYQLYWNTSVESFMKRMKKEHDTFWNTPWRKDSLASKNLTATEVYTLASIVEKETRLSSEKTTVAGVYLNRIKRGMKLEADPTVVYAVGDFTIRRVLLRHLETPSPYNTYLNEGLPPGPICMPSIESIDACLHAKDHNYIFFCAKPGYDGAHNFASTLGEHNRNARVFHNWLNKEKIKK